jgi:DedD protein
MERRVKERLVGASILVVLIVLVVPELLSGPAPPQPPAPSVELQAPSSVPEPVRHVTVDLATNKPAPAEPAPDAVTASTAAQSVPVAPGSAPPAEASGSAVVTTPSPDPAAPPLEPQAAHPISTSEGSKGVSGGRSWSVQLGSFASRDNAQKLLRQLKSQGFAAYVAPTGSGPAARYRVRVGPMQDRAAAMQAAIKLKTLGHESTLSPPAP